MVRQSGGTLAGALLAVPSQFYRCTGCGWIEHAATDLKTCSWCRCENLWQLTVIDVLSALRTHYMQQHKIDRERWERERQRMKEEDSEA